MNFCDYNELTNAEISSILRSADTCLLSVSDKNQPYSVPMKCKCRKECGKYIFTLKTCDHGMKTHCINENPKVCLFFHCISNDEFKTVIVLGCAKLCEIDCDCGKKEFEIEVTSNFVSGRSFCEKHKDCCDDVVLGDWFK